MNFVLEMNKVYLDEMFFNFNGREQTYEKIQELKATEAVATLADFQRLEELNRHAIGFYYHGKAIMYGYRRKVYELLDNPYYSEKVEDIIHLSYLELYQEFEQTFPYSDYTYAVLRSLERAMAKMYRKEVLIDEVTEKREEFIVKQSEKSLVYGMYKTFEVFNYQEVKELRRLMMRSEKMSDAEKQRKKRLYDRIAKMDKLDKLDMAGYIGTVDLRFLKQDYTFCAKLQELQVHNRNKIRLEKKGK